MASVQIRDVRKSFGAVSIIKGVDVEIREGEFVILVGPSGCGKSTLLRMIAGLEHITSGDILIGDRVVNNVPPKERDIAMVFQNYALYPHMKVADNMAFSLKLRKAPQSEIDQRVKRAAEILSLTPLLDRYPRQLSGGQRQRVAMGRAIVRDPQVFLFDEPLSNLDAKLREEMQIELRQIQRTLGTTTILVTHDQVEAMSLSDRIVVMNTGRVEQIGTPQETYERPASAFVANFLGKTNEFAGTIEVGVQPARIVAGSWSAPAPAGFSGPVTVSVRPEKIGFAGADQGLAARVAIRIFQGNHWLFQCETECGPAIVIRQNDGMAQPAEGEAVRLAWRPEDMSLRAAGARS
ncbi:ABC transporter ATP-binding protein [Prosthecomicrobium hirschii]|uniref:ABC transporter ATP-binding protein n=1 Tax=Prosthecodimorpha hirschii TaxID=665126 RepID=UPI0011285A9A|nr:sn-glycerol-3-phosphate ABC transporter ATP-binding protein UgpC [Prosthecomicrobium hirschii]TPQ51430.1 ABC transporter ATP-binding protein [Prosthecomicrobium hirschii]